MGRRRGRSTIEGFGALDRTFARIPDAVEPERVEELLLRNAKPLVDDMEARAPRLSGDLAASAMAGKELSPRQAALHRKKSDVEVFAGMGPLPQAITQEFGTFKEPPQPTVRPAWDANKRRIFDSVARDVAEEIDRAATKGGRR